MVRRVLDKSLFRPDEAEDGLVAVSKVSQMIERGEDPYAVILMDFMMPKMDGPTATRAIRGLGYTGIIIGITGTSSPQDLEIFTVSGANLVMPKPLDIDQLVKNIQCLSRRQNSESPLLLGADCGLKADSRVLKADSLDNVQYFMDAIP
eukprot:gene36814-biopygen28482